MVVDVVVAAAVEVVAAVGVAVAAAAEVVAAVGVVAAAGAWSEEGKKSWMKAIAFLVAASSAASLDFFAGGCPFCWSFVWYSL